MIISDFVIKCDTLIRWISHGSLAEFDPSGVQGHVSILGAAAQQNVLELLQIALLAQAEHEGAPHVRRVLHRQLQQRSGLLPLLHEPHTCANRSKCVIDVLEMAKMWSAFFRLTCVHQTARVVKST